MKHDSNREIAFNIALAQSLHVADLNKKQTTQFLQGSKYEQFWTLVSIRRLINYDLTEEERKEMDKKEEIVVDCFNKLKKDRSFVSMGWIDKKRQHKPQDTSQLIKNIKIYQDRLGDILKELGFFPKKGDRSRLSF